MPAPTVTIRPLRLHEVSSLRRLFVQALESDFSYFPAGYIKQVKKANTSLKFLRAVTIGRRRLVLVAVQGGELSGFAISSSHRDGMGHLYWLYVKPEVRNRKIGRQLLQATLGEMQRRRMAAMELVTHNFEGYYAKNGFWQRTKIHQHGTDLNVMQYDFSDNQVRHPRNVGRWVIRWPFWLGLIAVTVGIAYVQLSHQDSPYHVPALILQPAQPVAGSLVDVVTRQHYTAAQVTSLARQNYGAGLAASQYGVSRILLRYRTTGTDGKIITDYATAYIPDDVKGAPVVAMASGTTGLDASCAVSMEQPQVHNWANYQSHMMAYAAKGYTGIITDYDNMRGAPAGEIQPYLIGIMEGRGVLDSIRALKHLPEARAASDFNHTFTAGYSQGGHAALWADHLRASYAPDVKIAGSIAWGGVLNVGTTWAGITGGSTLVWFGPYILASYSHYYGHDYHLANILQPPWGERLDHDALGHCIDTDIPFYGVKPGVVYAPQFLADLTAGTLPPDRYGPLASDLAANEVPGTTSTPKLINQGAKDNVVLAAQQPPALTKLCSGGGPLDYALYADDTHYNNMVHSFGNTLNWMQDIIHGRQVRDTCPSGSPSPSATPSPTPSPSPAVIPSP
jgi:ribosomal protein S18 acetylase RimI-like enzyme